MRTKKEMIADIGEHFDEDKKYPLIPIIEKIIDEHSEATAIGFAQWIQFDYVPHYEGGRWVHESDVASKKKYTTEQLYSLYLEFLNEQK